MNPSKNTVCVISHWLPAQCLASSFPPLVSLSLLVCSGPLCPLLCLIRASLVLQSLCIQAPCPHWAPQHSFSNIQQKKAFLSDSFPSWCCTGVGLSMIEVCGSLYLRELLKLVWQQERLCYADHPVSVVSHLCSKMKRRQAMVPVSITSPDI